MQLKDLQNPIEAIRRGRPEDNSLEWKRQWWDFQRKEAKEEFRKDICALANSCQGEGGHIIVGVKGGQLFDAPLPRDEAELQEIGKEIMPPPNVKFTTFEIEDAGQRKTISLVSVIPPFDRPYVTRQGAHNLIFVRRGSDVGTATRFDLDAFYRSSLPSAKLEVSWEFWPGREIRTEDGVRGNILPVPAPRLRVREINPELEQRLKDYQRQSDETGYPTSELIEKFSSQIAPFVESLQRRDNLVFWSLKGSNKYLDSLRVSVHVWNQGSKPASGIKVRIRFPDWLYVFEEAPSQPESYVQEPFMPPPPRPKFPEGARSSMASTFGRQPHNFLPPLPYIPRPEPRSGSRLDPKTNSATFWAKRLLHAHSYSIEDPVRVLALPTAPVGSEDYKIEAEVFCEEFPDWERQTLYVSLVDDSGSD